MRRLILTAVAAAVIISLAGAAYAEPKYVPGVLLVKFKDVLEKGGKYPLETQYPGVNTLNRKYGVTKIEPLYSFLPTKPINDPNGKWKWKHWQEMMAKYRMDTYYVIKYDKKYDPKVVAKAYEANPKVDSATPECIGNWNYIPMDPLFPDQWHLNNTEQSPPGGTEGCDIDAVPAWDNWPIDERDGVVAVLDSGVQCYESAQYYGAHEDLEENFWFSPGQPEPWPGRNFVDPNYPPNDFFWHGTAVSGVFGATMGRGFPIEVGVASVCFNKAKILPCKVGDYSGPYLQLVCQAILWAAQNGADVENMSFSFYEGAWGGGEPPPVFSTAVKAAYSLGVVMVATLDNLGAYNVPVWPAWFKEVIAVNATDADDEKWIWSDWGQEIEFAAPGVHIWTTTMYPDKWEPDPDKYRPRDGTSFAAPTVSGMSALVQAWIYWVQDPPYDRTAIVRGKLKDCSDDVNHWGFPGWDEWIGWGRVNLDKLADDLYGGGGGADAGRLASTAAPFTFTAAVAPNPARGGTIFRVTLPANAPATEVEVAVFDLSGRKVASKAGTCPGEGTHEVAWDCRASNGAPLAPGVYIYRVKAGKNAVAGKVVVAK
jgi:thermitase